VLKLVRAAKKKTDAMPRAIIANRTIAIAVSNKVKPASLLRAPDSVISTAVFNSIPPGYCTVTLTVVDVHEFAEKLTLPLFFFTVTVDDALAVLLPLCEAAET